QRGDAGARGAARPARRPLPDRGRDLLRGRDDRGVGAAMIALLLAAAALPFTNPKAKDHLTPEEIQKLETLPERTRQLISEAADNVILGSAAHLRILMSLELPPQGMELVLQDNCILCHSDPGNVKPRVLFSPDPAKQGSNPLLNLKEFISDTHF